jgi:hypothetical protein
MTDSDIDYTNTNAIPFTKIDLEDESIMDYIDNILELAPIKFTPKGRQLFFKNI